MREIEEAMIRAIKLRLNGWRKINTRVTYSVTDWPYESTVFLFGNPIARAGVDKVGNVNAVPIETVVASWPTRTTVSRLRALGIDARVYNGTLHIDGQRIEP